MLDASNGETFQLEFAAKNLQSSSISLDLDDIDVASDCGNSFFFQNMVALL